VSAYCQSRCVDDISRKQRARALAVAERGARVHRPQHREVLLRKAPQQLLLDLPRRRVASQRQPVDVRDAEPREMTLSDRLYGCQL
jgi:hypothetical protein